VDAVGPGSSASSKKILVFSTSLSAIRKTFDECEKVKALLDNMGVEYEERDISLDVATREELRARLGGQMRPVPQVWLGEKHLGGAREVEEVAESGALQQMLFKQGRTRGRVFSINQGQALPKPQFEEEL